MGNINKLVIQLQTEIANKTGVGKGEGDSPTKGSPSSQQQKATPVSPDKAQQVTPPPPPVIFPPPVSMPPQAYPEASKQAEVVGADIAKKASENVSEGLTEGAKDAQAKAQAVGPPKPPKPPGPSSAAGASGDDGNLPPIGQSGGAKYQSLPAKQAGGTKNPTRAISGAPQFARQAAVVLGGGRAGAIGGLANAVGHLSGEALKLSGKFAKIAGPVAAGVAVGLTAIAVGAIVAAKAFKTLIATTQRVDKFLNQMADRTAEFSGMVAGAAAARELMLLRSQANQAQELAKPLSEFVIERGKLEAGFNDIKTELSKGFLTIANDVLPPLTDIAGEVANLVSILNDSGIVDLFGNLAEGHLRLLDFFAKANNYMLERQIEGAKFIPLLGTFLQTELDKNLDDRSDFQTQLFEFLTAPPEVPVPEIAREAVSTL